MSASRGETVIWIRTRAERMKSRPNMLGSRSGAVRSRSPVLDRPQRAWDRDPTTLHPRSDVPRSRYERECERTKQRKSRAWLLRHRSRDGVSRSSSRSSRSAGLAPPSQRRRSSSKAVGARSMVLSSRSKSTSPRSPRPASLPSPRGPSGGDGESRDIVVRSTSPALCDRKKAFRRRYPYTCSSLESVDERSARAARRRREWTGGVAESFAAMEEADLDFWQRMTPEERMGCVFEMWVEQSAPEEPGHEAPRRLQRSVGGTRPRRG